MIKHKHLNMTIDSDEVVVEETTEEVEEETTEEAPEVEETKPTETPEAKLARLKRQTSQLEKKLGITEEPVKATSNEPDYAKLAYLETKGVVHPDDQKIVTDEANRLKLPLTDVLQMEHIKNRLTQNNDARVTQDGMPKGSGRKGGEGKGSVEYYLAHPDEVPQDLELHNKVIDARVKKETVGNMFSSTPFVG